MPIKFAELIDPTTIFDRASELKPPPRKAIQHSIAGKSAEFDLRRVQAQLHPELPPTELWSYDGAIPGPTVVVDSGDHVHVRVHNTIDSALPYEHVVVDDGAEGGTMNQVGSKPASNDDADVKERESAHDLTACCVMHLHGAPSPPDSDGWAEGVITPGETAHHHYQFARDDFRSDTTGQGARLSRGGAGPGRCSGITITRWVRPGSTITPGSPGPGSYATRSRRNSACRRTNAMNCP